MPLAGSAAAEIDPDTRFHQPAQMVTESRFVDLVFRREWRSRQGPKTPLTSNAEQAGVRRFTGAAKE
jgi:hypothetical protein